MPQFPHPCSSGPLRYQTIGSFPLSEQPWGELLLSLGPARLCPTSHPIILLIKPSSPQPHFPVFGFGLLLSPQQRAAARCKGSPGQLSKELPKELPKFLAKTTTQLRTNKQNQRSRTSARAEPQDMGAAGPSLDLGSKRRRLQPCPGPRPPQLPAKDASGKGSRSVLGKEEQHCMAIAFWILSLLQMFCGQ